RRSTARSTRRRREHRGGHGASRRAPLESPPQPGPVAAGAPIAVARRVDDHAAVVVEQEPVPADPLAVAADADSHIPLAGEQPHERTLPGPDPGALGVGEPRAANLDRAVVA